MIDELLQQRHTDQQTLAEVKKLAKTQAEQEDDHEALAAVVAELPRRSNGHAR